MEKISDPDPFEDHLRHPTNQELVFVRNGLVISILAKDHRITEERARTWLDSWDFTSSSEPPSMSTPEASPHIEL